MWDHVTDAVRDQSQPERQGLVFYNAANRRAKCGMNKSGHNGGDKW
jgi:hypothetical protein